LQELPTSIRQLNAFQNLYLDNFYSLQELPTSIRQLNALQNLYLDNVIACKNYLHLLGN
jgi:hypothetical protein